MIGHLRGRLLESRPDELLLDVGGVGYRLQIPLDTLGRLQPDRGGSVSLHVHTHVREDAIQLYGFASQDERAAFERLIAVSGIGPRIALAVLSGIGVGELEEAVRSGHRAMLERIPGIGRKTAERVLLELRDRRADGRGSRRGRPAPPAEPGVEPVPSIVDDAIGALLNLGYGEGAASDAVVAAGRGHPGEATLEDLLRASLRRLVR